MCIKSGTVLGNNLEGSHSCMGWGCPHKNLHSHHHLHCLASGTPSQLILPTSTCHSFLGCNKKKEQSFS